MRAKAIENQKAAAEAIAAQKKAAEEQEAAAAEAEAAEAEAAAAAEADAGPSVRCRGCRVELCLGSQVAPCAPGRGCTSLFVRSQLAWMQVQGHAGKLYCPTARCKAKLGAWCWHGAKCSCGQWCAPSFQLHLSKVDRPE